MKTSYHGATDSLYVEVRPLPAHDTVELQDDILVDLGEDGAPVGYDIQHASAKAAFIAKVILEEPAAAAE